MKPLDNVSKLRSLGSGVTNYPNRGGVQPQVLERFPNKFQKNMYEVRFVSKEFTSLCPKTGQPDFGEIHITYVPDKWCIESKGLKLYLFSYRDEPTFMETLTNRILIHLVRLVQPHTMSVLGVFAPRGGIGLDVLAQYNRKKGFNIQARALKDESN